MNSVLNEGGHNWCNDDMGGVGLHENIHIQIDSSIRRLNYVAKTFLKSTSQKLQKV